MPKRHRMARLLEMITLIRNNRNLRPGDLAERFGISKKRIHDDIQDLSMAGVPIVFVGAGYRIMEGFFLPPTAYNLEEALAIILALHLAEQKGGCPDGVSARSLLSKILGALPGGDYRGLLEESDRMLDDGEADLSPHISAVTQGIVDRKTLEVRYFSLSGARETDRRIDGYAVAYRRNSWYLIGYCHLREEVRTFKINRIRKARKTERTYRIPEDFSVESYLKHSWGILSGESNRIRIRFSPRISSLIEEKRFPNALFLRQEDGTLVLEADAGSLDEVRWWAMQYGADAEVLDPQELRDAVREQVRKMAEIYDGETRPSRNVSQAGLP